MNEVIIILSIFIFSYFIILRNYNYSVYLMLFLSVLLHKELFSFYRWDLMPIRAFMVAILFATLTKAYFHYLKKKDISNFVCKIKDPVFISIVALWIIRGVSIIFSKNLQASLLAYAFFTTIVFLASYIYLNLKEHPENVIKFLKFYSYLVFGLTIFGYVQLILFKFTGITIGALWSIPGNIPRVGSTFWDVNHYGALLSSLIPFTALMVITVKDWKLRLFNVVMAASMLASLFLTNSRSAWIMAFISFMVFITVIFVRRFGTRGILYIFIGILVISVPLLAEYSVKSSPFRAKIKQYFHYRMDSFDSHFMLLTGAVQIFEEYPFLGGGYGSFFEHFSKSEIAPTYFGRDPAALNTRVPAHTIWGEVLAETGVLGFSAFLIFCVLIITPALYLGLRSKNRLEYLFGTVISSVFIGWLSAGIFYSYNSEFFWIIIFLYSAWAAGTVKKYISGKDLFSHFFWTEKFSIIFLALFSFVLIFTSLGRNHLIPYDEAIYAEISKNMVSTGDYIVQRWVPEKVWYEKPPLYMWAMSGFMNLLGVGSLAAKLPSAISGFLLIGVVYLFSRKLFGKLTAFLSSFILLTTTQFLYYSRMAMLDVTATLFITSALGVYYVSKSSSKKALPIISGLLIGLAVMTKGVVGLLPFLIIFLYEAYLFITKQQKLSRRLVGDYLLIVFSSLVIFMPWHLEMYRRFNGLFINNYIIYHVWDRATSSIEDKGRPFFWYLVVMKVSMRIWFVGLLAAVPLFVSKLLKRDNKHVFLFIWAFFMLVFFSSAKSKLIWYIIPIYPVVSIMVARLIAVFIEFRSRKFNSENIIFFKTVVLFILIFGSLFYLFLNRGLSYTSDLTGSQARLLQKKDLFFGTSQMLYADRVERPLSLFYSDGPFLDVDFNPELINRVPVVQYNEQLVLLTKKGRFSENVSGYDYKPQIVQEDGDWILWYLDSKEYIDSLKTTSESSVE